MSRNFVKIILMALIFLNSACSYKPIFSEKNYNFEINKVSFSGEKDINKIIKSRLNLIKKTNQTNKLKYDVSILSEIDKKIISKDSKGDPLKFELIVITSFKVKKNENILLSKKIKKNNIYNNISDKFKLEQNEKSVIENLAEIISDSIVSSIINIDDN